MILPWSGHHNNINVNYLQAMQMHFLSCQLVLEHPALIQAAFHVGDCYWAQENWQPTNQKTISFQDKFYSLKDHVY